MNTKNTSKFATLLAAVMMNALLLGGVASLFDAPAAAPAGSAVIAGGDSAAADAEHDAV